MSVRETSKTIENVAAVRRRRMRITLSVAVKMVESMVTDPIGHGSLAGHTPDDGQDSPRPPRRFEGAMSEEPMKANFNASRRKKTHRDELGDVCRAIRVPQDKVD